MPGEFPTPSPQDPSAETVPEAIQDIFEGEPARAPYEGEFELPHMFDIQVKSIVGDYPWGISAGSIIYKIFGRLPDREFLAAREEIYAMLKTGQLARENNLYTLPPAQTDPGQAEAQEISDYQAQQESLRTPTPPTREEVKKLDKMLGAAGILGRPARKPRKSYGGRYKDGPGRMIPPEK